MHQVLLQEVQEEGVHQRGADPLLLACRAGHRGPHHRAVGHAHDAGGSKEEEEVCVFIRIADIL